MKSFYFFIVSLLIASQTVHAQIPTLTCPGNTTVNNAAGLCGEIVSYTAPVCATNCAGTTIYQSDLSGLTSGGGFPLDTTIQEYTITNGVDSSTCSFLIIVVDAEAPTFSPPCPGNITVSSDPGLCGTSTTYTRPKGIDNCGVPTTLQTDGTGLTAGSFFPVGVTNQIYVATDTAGNIATCSFTVTVVDVEAPTIANCPTPQTFFNDIGTCDTTAVYIMPTGADNCTNTTFTQIDGSGLSSGMAFPVGSTFQEFSVADNEGNIGAATCIIEIVVIDIEIPTVTCAGIQSQFADANCQIVIADYSSTMTVLDNCDANPTITQSPLPGTIVSAPTTITLTATDASGNSSPCPFDLILVDTISPTITCPSDQNVSASSSCQAVLGDYTGMAVMTDNCDASPVASQSPIAGTPITSSQIVTLTATDYSSNTSTCTFLVTVDDAIAPTIVACAPDETVYVDANCDFTLPDYTSLLTVTDNCDANPAISQSPLPGSTVPGGSGPIFISFTVTDVSGNPANCSFLLSFIDTVAPSLSCPADQTAYLDANCESTILDYSSLVVGVDNCGGAVSLTQSPAAMTLFSGSSSPVPVTYSAQDALGNISTCVFNVNALDTISPSVISCANDTTINADANCEYIMDDFTGFITGTDNCASVLGTSQSVVVGTSFAIGGPYPINLSISDDFNNTASCSFKITVIDITPPTLICPTNPSVPADNNCNYIIPSYDTILNIVENCSSFTYSQTVTAGTILSGIGTQQTISLFVQDVANNTNSCSFTITIADTTAPTIVCHADTTLDLNANCQYTIPDFTGLVTVTDFCDGSPSISQDPAAGVTLTGINAITITATDLSGNSNTCTFNVFPNDTVIPTIVCPANISSCDNIQSYTVANGVDDCSGSLVAVQTGNTTYSSGSTFPVGISTLEYSVTDASGNTKSCTFDIEIFPPVVIFAGTYQFIEEGESITIDANVTNGNNFIWTPSNYRIDDYTLLNPTVSPTLSTFYVLSATSLDGCTGKDSVLIAVNTIDSLEINNFLSPNGDGSNEYWTMNKPSLISGCWVSIYNRWGKLVWESESYDNNWNGVNKKGEPLPESTYFYVISCAGEEYKGSILLMR